jgi:hypothetical protein
MKPLLFGGTEYAVQCVDAAASVYTLTGPKGGRYFVRPDGHRPDVLRVTNRNNSNFPPAFIGVRLRVVGDALVVAEVRHRRSKHVRRGV